MDRSMQNSQERVQKLRWPKWADAIVAEERGQVIRCRYEDGEAYPYCRLCEKWCSQEHTLSKLHLRRKWWHNESRVVSSDESGSLHSEACNAPGASNDVIHSNISHEAAGRMAINRWGSHSVGKVMEVPVTVQQERLQQCLVEQVVHVPKVWMQEAVIHAPEIVSQRWEQQRTVEPAHEPVEWQDWAQWRRNGWQWR